ncbi:MAG: DALR domain-containing protein, partial [Candidatus Deferrimicrobium sp.]
EIAQSEAATGKPFARYWLHNGFVNVNDEKMSKSLGNFFTLRDVLAQVKPEVLRFFLASSHYRSPIDYSDQSLTEAKAGLDRLYRVKEKAEASRTAGAAPSSVPEGEEFDPLRNATARFAEGMDDDFNTAAALGHLFDAVRALNRLAPAEPSAERERAGQFLSGYAILEPLFGVLGLLRMSAGEYFQVDYNYVGVGTLTSSAASEHEFVPAGRLSKDKILGRIEARKAARAAKQYAEADRIRRSSRRRASSSRTARPERPGNTKRDNVPSGRAVCPRGGPAGGDP